MLYENISSFRSVIRNNISKKIMKFRCRMVDAGSMRDFTNVVNTLSRLAKICAMRLSTDKVCFHVGDDYSTIAWAEMSQQQFFSEYTMCGVSDDQNEIYLEFSPAMLSKSLNTLRMSAKSVKIKLTNKQQPCLTIDVELPSICNESRQCMHDVPVKVIPRKEWPEYQAPVIPKFDISIEMPQLKHVRKVVDQMTKMGPQLILSAKKSGKLMLKIETSFATVATHFQGLIVEGGTEDDNNEEIIAVVDIKKFGMFLAWEVIKPEGVMCNIVNDRMINMCMNIQGHLKIHYFIPAVSM